MTFSALDSAITGPLFATPAMEAVFSDQARVAGMLRMQAALAQAQGHIDLARAIEGISPVDLDLAVLGRGTALAGVPVIPFVKAVQARLPAELERSFHRGATTQDVADTALMLQMREAFDLVRADLIAILNDLARVAEAYRGAPCVGRTYGQHAAPVTFGFKAAVWLSGMADAASQLPNLRQRVLVASLSGPVGTLAVFGSRGPEILEAFAGCLGLGVAPIAWHTTRGRMVEVGTWLATLIGALAKMATDVAHLMSTEVAELAEPYVHGRGGSSAMPHKRNPVSSTVILAAHAAAKGPVTTLLDAMAAAHERPVGLWHAEWHALPALFGFASGALREARALAEGLEVDPVRMRANLDATRGLLFADAAAGLLAPSIGREAAHRLVEHAAGEVRSTGRSLAEVLRDETDEPLDAAFDLEPAISASALWTDRAVAAARNVQGRL
jgi:3-carboxy-cis,cis-muconate cycloisomerase